MKTIINKKFSFFFFFLFNVHINYGMFQDLVNGAIGEDTSFLKKMCIGLTGYGVLKTAASNSWAYFMKQMTKGIPLQQAEQNLEAHASNEYDSAVLKAVRAFNFNNNDKQRIKVHYHEGTAFFAHDNSIFIPETSEYLTDENSMEFVIAKQLAKAQESNFFYLKSAFNITFPPLYYLGIHATMNVIDQTLKHIKENSNSALLKGVYPFLSNLLKSNGAHLFIHLTTWPFFTTQFNHYLEKRTDIKAVRTLKNAQGGIEYVKRFQFRGKESNFTKITNYFFCRNSVSSDEQRISYLGQIQKDFDKKEVELR